MASAALPAILGLIGTGAAVGGSIGSNVSTNRTNREIAEQTNRTNLEINASQLAHADQAAAEAYQRQRQLYTDFYSPAALVNQYKNAGLSVGMMYGSGGAGGHGGTSVQQANTPNAIPQQMYQQQNILDAQTASLMADAAKKAAETKNIETDTDKKVAEQGEIQQRIEGIKKEIELNNTKIENTIADTLKKYEEQATEVSKQKDYESQMSLRAKQEEFVEAQKKYYESMEQLNQIDLKYRDQINEATAKEIQARASEAYAAARKMNIEAETAEKMRNDILTKAYYEGLQAYYNYYNVTPKQRELIEAEIEQINAGKKSQEEINAFINKISFGNEKIAGFWRVMLARPKKENKVMNNLGSAAVGAAIKTM